MARPSSTHPLPPIVARSFLPHLGLCSADGASRHRRPDSTVPRPDIPSPGRPSPPSALAEPAPRWGVGHVSLTAWVVRVASGQIRVLPGRIERPRGSFSGWSRWGYTTPPPHRRVAPRWGAGQGSSRSGARPVPIGQLRLRRAIWRWRHPSTGR